MDELPARAKTVLRHAQEYDQCRDQDARQRVREGVARAVGPSALAQPRNQTRAALPASGAKLAGLSGKLGATTLLVALLSTGVALRYRAADSRDQSTVRASVSLSAPASLAQPAPTPKAPLRPAAAPVVEPLPHEQGARDVGERARVGAERRVRTLPSDTLDAEVALFRRLGEAISRRDTRAARRLLARHQARFPQPALLEEREGFQALVGCIDQSPSARSSSRAFALRYPNSVLTARVLHECEPLGAAR